MLSLRALLARLKVTRWVSAAQVLGIAPVNWFEYMMSVVKAAAFVSDCGKGPEN